MPAAYPEARTGMRRYGWVLVAHSIVPSVTRGLRCWAKASLTTTCYTARRGARTQLAAPYRGVCSGTDRTPFTEEIPMIPTTCMTQGRQGGVYPCSRKLHVDQLA
jgi:hypothetical protein